MRFSVAVLVSLVYLTGSRLGSVNAGPFKLVQYEACEDPGIGHLDNDIRIVEKSKDKSFLQGHLHVPFDYDDSLKEELNFSRLGSEGWEFMGYKIQTENYCSSFKNKYPMLFEYFFQAWGIKNPSCPIKAGNYTIDMDTDLPNSPILGLLPEGSYKLSHALLTGNPPVRYKCTIWYLNCTEAFR